MAWFKNKFQNEQDDDRSTSTGADKTSQSGASEKTDNGAWAYAIVKRPVVTEKTYKLTESNTYTFEVSPQANKPQVKKAVETLFEVPVKHVRIVNNKPQSVSFQQRFGQTRHVKKALVSVSEGHSISL